MIGVHIIRRTLSYKKHFINLPQLNELTKSKYDVGLCLLNKNKLKQEDLLSLPYKLKTQLDLKTVLGTTVDNVSDNEEKDLCLILFNNKQVYPFYFIDEKVKDINFSQVGRWKNQYEQEINGNDKFFSVSQASNNVTLPSELRRLEDEKQGTLLLFGDHKVQQYLQMMDSQLNKINKVGLIASNTMFNNSLRNTLYYDNNVYEHGMVGLFFKDKMKLESNYFNMIKLGNKMSISQSQGNIILKLNEYGATQYLLDQLKNMHINKELDLFIKLERQNMDSIFLKVLSGDPKLGNMAIQTKMDLKVGDQVEFYYQSKTDTNNSINIGGKGDIMNIKLKSIEDTLVQDNSTIYSEQGVFYNYNGKICNITNVPYTTITIKE